MNIDAYINKLLFDHDCVIVPGLGGFVASPRSAIHNKVHHSFIPPARVIAFNVFLRQNDGLLANYISSEEKIPFSEAMGFLEKYVERCFIEMEAGGRFIIAEVGELYYDAEKNIQFEPDNSALHFYDSFGLTNIRAVPVGNKEQKENILLSPLRQSVSPKEKEKRKRQRKFSGRRMMNAMLIAGITLWASFNLYIIAPHHFNFSGLNPFYKTESAKPTVKEKTFTVTENKNTAPTAVPVLPQVESKDEIKNQVPSDKINPENIEVKKAEENIPDAPVKEIVPESIGNYFVVAGVFKIPSNAENFLAKLKADGYENSGSLEKENKPTMIFVTQHRQKEEALQSMRHLKENGMDAWIFSRKK